MTLRDLEQLKHRSKCSKTTLPESYVPMTKYSDKTANGLTTAIVDFIRLTGGYADRINNTGIMRNGKWTRSGTRKGIADIMAGKPIQVGDRTISATVAIEVKIGKDRQSDDQKKVQQELENSGGFYIIARNWYQFYYEWSQI